MHKRVIIAMNNSAGSRKNNSVSGGKEKAGKKLHKYHNGEKVLTLSPIVNLDFIKFLKGANSLHFFDQKKFFCVFLLFQPDDGGSTD